MKIEEIKSAFIKAASAAKTADEFVANADALGLTDDVLKANGLSVTGGGPLGFTLCKSDDSGVLV